MEWLISLGIVLFAILIVVGVCIKLELDFEFSLLCSAIAFLIVALLTIMTVAVHMLLF